jgi:predicted nucleotide-binding protein
MLKLPLKNVKLNKKEQEKYLSIMVGLLTMCPFFANDLIEQTTKNKKLRSECWKLFAKLIVDGYVEFENPEKAAKTSKALLKCIEHSIKKETAQECIDKLDIAFQNYKKNNRYVLTKKGYDLNVSLIKF